MEVSRIPHVCVYRTAPGISPRSERPKPPLQLETELRLVRSALLITAHLARTADCDDLDDHLMRIHAEVSRRIAELELIP
jgi:hypothetical protein